MQCNTQGKSASDVENSFADQPFGYQHNDDGIYLPEQANAFASKIVYSICFVIFVLFSRFLSYFVTLSPFFVKLTVKRRNVYGMKSF